MLGLAAHGFAAGLLVSGLTGCGEPGSPQPPSLNLPVPVANLTALRTGDTVHLAWSTIDKTTDHTSPTGLILTRVCRIEDTGPCERVADLRITLGVGGASATGASYDDILPVTMTTGHPTLLTYYVELVNHAQKSAGRSNAAFSADGPAVPALTGLAGSVRAEGVVLHWEPVGGDDGSGCKVSIERLDLTPPARNQQERNAPGSGRSASLLRQQPASPHQTLEVAGTQPDGKAQSMFEAMDTTAAFGQSYEYRARRVQTLTLAGHTIELLGEQSSPATVETRDTFPPSVPQDLAAVADPSSHAIDLSWAPDTEPDLAGYIVYRQNPVGHGRETFVRISGPTPLPTPAFHDSNVVRGSLYVYTVSAVDQSGNESAQSGETDESLAASPQ